MAARAPDRYTTAVAVKNDKPQTILACFPHADDEMGVLGTLLNHLSRGDRVVLAWATRGEMTSLFGDKPMDEIVTERKRHTEEVARIVGCEIRQLEFPDARIGRSHEEALELARLVADVRPDAIVTWNVLRGHPDHRNTGHLLQDAVTYARLPRMVAPLPAHRPRQLAFLAYYDEASPYPPFYVDVTPHMDKITEVMELYAKVYHWKDAAANLRRRRAAVGAECGVKYAEKFNLVFGPRAAATYLL